MKPKKPKTSSNMSTKAECRILKKIQDATNALAAHVNACPYGKHLDWLNWIEDPDNGLTDEQREEQLECWFEEGERLHPQLA